MDYYPINSYFSSDISDDLELSLTNSVESLFSDIPEESTTPELPQKKKRGRPPKPKIEAVAVTSMGKKICHNVNFPSPCNHTSPALIFI
jgi:hypothetical protein